MSTVLLDVTFQWHSLSLQAQLVNGAYVVGSRALPSTGPAGKTRKRGLRAKHIQMLFLRLECYLQGRLSDIDTEDISCPACFVIDHTNDLEKRKTASNQLFVRHVCGIENPLLPWLDPNESKRTRRGRRKAKRVVLDSPEGDAPMAGPSRHADALVLDDAPTTPALAQATGCSNSTGSPTQPRAAEAPATNPPTPSPPATCQPRAPRVLGMQNRLFASAVGAASRSRAIARVWLRMK